MELQLTVKEQSMVIGLTDFFELDLYNVTEFGEDLLLMIGKPEYAHINKIILDFSHISHVDSSGMGKLIYLKKNIESNGRSFFFTNLSPRIRQLLELTAAIRYFTILD